MSDDDAIHGSARPSRRATSAVHHFVERGSYCAEPLDLTSGSGTYPYQVMMGFKWISKEECSLAHELRGAQELFHQFVNCAPSDEAAQPAVGRATNKRKAPLDHDREAQLRTAGRPAQWPHDTYPPNSNKRPRVTTSPAPAAAVPAPVVPASTTSACHNCGRPGHSAWQCYSGGSTDKNPTRTTQQQRGNHNHWTGRKRKQGPAPAQQPRQSTHHSTTSTPQRTRGPAAGSTVAANYRNYTNRASSNNNSNSSYSKRARRGGR